MAEDKITVKYGQNGNVIHCIPSDQSDAFICKLRMIEHAYRGNFTMNEIPAFDVPGRDLGTFDKLSIDSFYAETRGREIVFVPEPFGNYNLECKVNADRGYINCGEF